MKRPPIYNTYHYVHRFGDKYAFRVGDKHVNETKTRIQTKFVVEVFKAAYPQEALYGGNFPTYKEAVKYGNEVVDELEDRSACVHVHTDKHPGSGRLLMARRIKAG